MDSSHIKIDDAWKQFLEPEFNKPYFDQLVSTLKLVKKQGATIYPPGPLIFNAFNLTPLDKTKVVIIGQDPYHKAGQAMGLSFSVPKSTRRPPSLLNIYKEIHTDIGCAIPDHGDLSAWAKQGVLMLNAILTVEEGKPGSHKMIGWQTFTDGVIQLLSSQKKGLVFLLWGAFARSKKSLIDTSKHRVLEAAHPSPLARGAFFGSQHFSKTNTILTSQGQEPIDWQII